MDISMDEMYEITEKEEQESTGTSEGETYKERIEEKWMRRSAGN